MKNFIDKKIKKNEQNLNNPIKKNMLLTFDSTEKKVASKPKGITVALRSDRDTFARLLLIQKDRDIDLKETLQFELTPLPLSLANTDGTLSKTVKSELFAQLSKSIPQVTLLLKNTVSIFDGMFLFQKPPLILVTFGDRNLQKPLSYCILCDRFLHALLYQINRAKTTFSHRVPEDQEDK